MIDCSLVDCRPGAFECAVGLLVSLNFFFNGAERALQSLDVVLSIRYTLEVGQI